MVVKGSKTEAIIYGKKPEIIEIPYAGPTIMAALVIRMESFQLQ
jgi:hypothetical protein